jgi:beta-glucosidase
MFTTKRLAYGLCLLSLDLVVWANGTVPYKNPHLSVDQRVADLVGRMTIEDKMAQLIQGVYY